MRTLTWATSRAPPRAGHVGRRRHDPGGRRGREDDRDGLGRVGHVDIEHVNDDDARIVLAAHAVGRVDELLGRAGGRLRCAMRSMSRSHHGREPVGAQDDAIALTTSSGYVDLDRFVEAQRASDVALRMRLGLLRSEAASRTSSSTGLWSSVQPRSAPRRARGTRVARVRSAPARRRRPARSSWCPCR